MDVARGLHFLHASGVEHGCGSCSIFEHSATLLYRAEAVSGSESGPSELGPSSVIAVTVLGSGLPRPGLCPGQLPLCTIVMK